MSQHRTRIAALLLTALVCLPGCGGGAPSPAAGEQPHVVVVLIDTLRCDALGCYGNPADTTPNIDAVAAEGVRFDQALSTSGWTLPAVGSLLTGTWPMIHGGLGKKTTLSPIRAELPTAAEVLKDAGYRTVAVANAAFVSPLLGLDRGFETFDHRYAYNQEIRRADESIDAALAQIRAAGGSRPVFSLIHLFDPHLDFDPPPEWRSRFTGGRTEPEPPLGMQMCLAAAKAGSGDRPTQGSLDYIRGVYLGEVGFVDQQIGRLVAGLRESGLWDDTLLVITSDHGEEFWDHGGFEHGHTLYDELIRIPLVVKLPASLPPARPVVDEQVRLLDVMPTAFELAGIGAPESFVGASLLPLIRGEERGDRVGFAEATLYGAEKLAWRTGTHKVVFTQDRTAPTVEVYDRTADPLEQSDLSAVDPELTRRLMGELDGFVRDLAQQAATMSELEPILLSPAEVERLESLGYIR
jgi:arylsulfatase A-like enzyme